MEILEYIPSYEEDIKNLLIELQKYIISIDRDKYNIMTENYRQEYFNKTMSKIKENNGKIFLASDNNKIVGFVVGIIIEEEYTYDFKAPKGGRITELVVSKDFRAKGIGQLLLYKIEEYFKNIGCKRILIEVFEYNDVAKDFYYKNHYSNRVIDIMKKI